MKILLDTNILDSNPRRDNPTFLTLTELASADYIEIWIPEIVDREYLSHLEEGVYGIFSVSNESTKRLKRVVGDRQADSLLDEAYKLTSPFEKQALSWVIQEYTNWKIKAKVKLLKIHDSSADEVFDSYFGGNLPFKSKRSKLDLPDAFIHNATIKRFGSKGDLTCIITNDDTLGASFANYNNIFVFKGLRELFESVIFSPILSDKRKRDLENETVNLIRNQLKFHLSYIERQIYDDIYSEAEYYYESDYSLATIGHPAFEGIAARDAIELKINDLDASYNGIGSFSLPIDGYATIVFSHIFSRDKFYSMSASEQNKYDVADDNEEYVYAYSEEIGRFKTDVSIKFDILEIENGDVLSKGLGLAIYQTKIELEGDVKFSD